MGKGVQGLGKFTPVRNDKIFKEERENRSIGFSQRSGYIGKKYLTKFEDFTRFGNIGVFGKVRPRFLQHQSRFR
jgi:hypothetical protein